MRMHRCVHLRRIILSRYLFRTFGIQRSERGDREERKRKKESRVLNEETRMRYSYIYVGVLKTVLTDRSFPTEKRPVYIKEIPVIIGYLSRTRFSSHVYSTCHSRFAVAIVICNGNPSHILPIVAKTPAPRLLYRFLLPYKRVLRFSSVAPSRACAPRILAFSVTASLLFDKKVISRAKCLA